VTAATAGDAAAAADAEPTYLASLMVVLWKPVFLLVSVGNMLLAFGIVKALSDNPIGYAFVVAALVAVPIAYFELRLLYVAMKWEDGPVVEPLTRTRVLSLAGYAFCLIVAIALAVNEAGERASAAEHAREVEREDQERRAVMNSPDVQRGMAVLQRVQELKAQREAARAQSRPSANKPGASPAAE
jgi:hypothetical protein